MFNLDIDDIASLIPTEASASLQKALTDVILKSKNAQALPSTLAKNILNLYHNDRLKSTEGFKTLLEASVLLEREKTAEKLEELNLNEAAEKVKGA